MRALRVVVVAVALRSLSVAQDAAWPQFRGPNASGVAAPDAAPPLAFGPSKHMLWKLPVPQGHSSPTVWGDRVFLTTFDPASKKLELICASGKPGAILGRRPAPATEIEQTHVVSNP